MSLRLLTTPTVVRRPETLPNAQCLVKTVCVHLVEIYFSIVQRKVLTPNDFTELSEVPERLLAFQSRYEAIARPFLWTFTRDDLANVLKELDPSLQPSLARAA